MLDKTVFDYSYWCAACSGPCKDKGIDYNYLRPGSVVANRPDGLGPPIIGIITEFPERQFTHVFHDILINHHGETVTGLSAQHTTLIPITPNEAAAVGLISPALVEYCATHGGLFIGPHQRLDIGAIEWRPRSTSSYWRCVETHHGYREPE